MYKLKLIDKYQQKENMLRDVEEINSYKRRND